MPWIFLTNNNDEDEAMDIVITKKILQLDSSVDTYVNLIDSINKPQGVHKRKTTLFSIYLQKLLERHLPKNPQTVTMNLLNMELQPLF